MNMIPCMGGWCIKRDKCPHYMAEAIVTPRERLCLTGKDGERIVETSPFRSILIDIFGAPQEMPKAAINA